MASRSDRYKQNTKKNVKSTKNNKKTNDKNNYRITPYNYLLLLFKNYINIKRWNSESNEWTETLKKTVLGKEYVLAPDSPLWIWAFPSNATSANENLTQNY